MAKVGDEPFVLPEPLARLREHGIETFCVETFPSKVRSWPGRIKNPSLSAEITALVDSATSETSGDKETIRLLTGPNVIEIDWRRTHTAVHGRPHGAAIFDLYATMGLRWNGSEVLNVRMAGDDGGYSDTWHIIAIERFEGGTWMDAVARLNEKKSDPEE